MLTKIVTLCPFIYDINGTFGKLNGRKSTCHLGTFTIPRHSVAIIFSIYISILTQKTASNDLFPRSIYDAYQSFSQ